MTKQPQNTNHTDVGRRDLVKKISLGIAGAFAAAVPARAIFWKRANSTAQGRASTDSIFTPREDHRVRMENGRKKPLL